MPCPHNPCCHSSCHHHPCYNTCTCSNSSTDNLNQQQQQQQQQLLQALTTILFPSPPPPIPITPLYSSSFQYQHQYEQQYQLQKREEQDALRSLHQRIVALESQLLQPHHHHHQQKNPKAQQQQEEEEVAVHSLLQRIAALETTQQPHHPSPPQKQTRRRQQPQPTVTATTSRVSLRDLAAKTIQVAFRRFLVRRSQTLRYLKDLALIKSRVAALKPVLSSGKDRRHDPRAVSQAAMDLIVQLESIQSGDPMIREGKRSISRELFRIMDFVDKFMIKEHHYEEKDRDLDEGNRSSVRDRAKRVSFLDNGKSLGNDLFDEGYCDASGEQNGYVDSLGEGFVGIHLRDRLEELQHVSDDERSSESSSLENGGRNVSGGQLKIRSTNRGLSAPMPAQMEPRKN